MADRINTKRAIARTRKMRARNYHLVRIFTFLIVMALAFLAGFQIRDHPKFLASLGLPESVTGISKTATNDTAAKAEDVFTSLPARIKEADTLLSTDSLDTYELSHATEAMLEALAAASEDPYMRYYSNERYTELLSKQNESYAGIGVLFSEYNGQAYVVDVFEGSDAQLSDVREGDFVVSVAGDSSQSWSRAEVTTRLAQSEGSNIVITWRRPESLEADGGDEFTTTLPCQQYDEPNVTSDYNRNRKVGYVGVRQITENVTVLVKKALEDLTAQGATSFVLDLRDNPGGYLSQAVDLASLFMSSGTVVELRTTNGISAKAASGQPVTSAPLVVLVNKNTAAAAEVIAAALKESQRANALVGETTLGKGSVQVISELSYGGALRYTAGYYLTPEGHDIDRVGVTPTQPLDASTKAQRDYAIELASSMVVED